MTLNLLQSNSALDLNNPDFIEFAKGCGALGLRVDYRIIPLSKQ